jgi:hypothetical protein
LQRLELAEERWGAEGLAEGLAESVRIGRWHVVEGRHWGCRGRQGVRKRRAVMAGVWQDGYNTLIVLGSVASVLFLNQVLAALA